MKKLILTTIAAVTLSFNVSADTGEEDYCKSVHELATKIMYGRQTDVDMPKLMEVVNGNKLAEELIMNAYSKPSYSVEKNQDREIKQFANEYYLACKRLEK